MLVLPVQRCMATLLQGTATFGQPLRGEVGKRRQEPIGRGARGQAGGLRHSGGQAQSHVALVTARPLESAIDGTAWRLIFMVFRRSVLDLLISSPEEPADANSIRARRRVFAVHEWISFLRAVGCVAWRGLKPAIGARSDFDDCRSDEAPPGIRPTLY